MEVRFLELAQKELAEIYEYYEYQQLNLGLRFIIEVEKSIELNKILSTRLASIVRKL